MKEMQKNTGSGREGAPARAGEGQANARVATAVKKEAMLKWYVDRMASTVAPASAPVKPIVDEAFRTASTSRRDYDTDIDRAGGWRASRDEERPARQQARLPGVLTH